MINTTMEDVAKAIYENMIAHPEDMCRDNYDDYSYIYQDYFRDSSDYDKGNTKITIRIKDLIGKCKTKEAATQKLKEIMGNNFNNEKMLDSLYYDIGFDLSGSTPYMTGKRYKTYNNVQHE